MEQNIIIMNQEAEPHTNSFLISTPCFLCQKLFNNMEELHKHLKSHETEPLDSVGSIACDLCGRVVQSERKLAKHYQRFHEAHVKNSRDSLLKDKEEQQQQQQPTKCQTCGKMYMNEEYLRVHMRTKHAPLTKAASPRKISPIRKYPLRSPYFNPNLWLVNAAQIEGI